VAALLVAEMLGLVGGSSLPQAVLDEYAERLGQPDLVVGPGGEEDRGPDLVDGDRRLLDRDRIGLRQEIPEELDDGGELAFALQLLAPRAMP
jgi:hypothetical protein